MRKEEYNRIPWSFLSAEVLVQEHVAFWGCQCQYSLIHGLNTLTLYSLRVLLNSYALWVH